MFLIMQVLYIAPESLVPGDLYYEQQIEACDYKTSQTNDTCVPPNLDSYDYLNLGLRSLSVAKCQKTQRFWTFPHKHT